MTALLHTVTVDMAFSSEPVDVLKWVHKTKSLIVVCIHPMDSFSEHRIYLLAMSLGLTVAQNYDAIKSEQLDQHFLRSSYFKDKAR